MPRLPKRPKSHPFTEEQIRAKAYALWQQRGKDSTDAENWDDAIKALQRERVIRRVTSPLQRWWHWTGLPEKKGWDLATGISIPLVLFLGSQYFTSQNNEKQEQLADDKAKQDTLVKYLDQMADSLQHGLLKAKPGDDQFIVAQSRTVLALQSLDRKRQHLVIQFLSASGLNDQLYEDSTLYDEERQLKLPSKTRVLLYKAQLSKANLVNSDLSGAVLIGANLDGANLGCKLPESRERGQCSDLSLADFRGANLVYADFKGANLHSADFKGANLVYADFKGASLTNANFRSADSRSADFRGADFNDTNLSSVNLESANLSEANLTNTLLGRATNLNSATLLHTDLRQAYGLIPELLEGENPPLLCNVALPKGLTVNPNRDCDRVPQILVKFYPKDFKTLKDAEAYVNKWRQKKWTDEPPGK